MYVTNTLFKSKSNKFNTNDILTLMMLCGFVVCCNLSVLGGGRIGCSPSVSLLSTASYVLYHADGTGVCGST